MNACKSLLKASTLSIALLGATAVATVVMAPDVAYAGKGNDKGGGNGGGKGASSDKGNGGGKGASSSSKGGGKGKSASASSSGKGASTRSGNARPRFSLKAMLGMESEPVVRQKKKRTTKVVKKAATERAPKVTKAPAPKPRGNRLAAELGVHPSELGALNAANASPTALENAAPNSRVGKLAAYADEVRESAALESELETAQAELDQLDEPTRSQDEIDTAIQTANDEKAALEAERDALNEALAEAGGSDPDIEADIATVEGDLMSKDTEIAGLEQERVDGEAYAVAEEEVERLESELDTQSADQRAALEAAANKEVTDEVEQAVQAMLGLVEEETETSE